MLLQQPWRTGAWVPALLRILLFLLPEQKTGMRSMGRWRCLSWGLTGLRFSPGGLSYHQWAPACCCPCLSHLLSHPQEFRKAPSAGLALTLFQGLPSCARCHFLLPYDTMSGSSKQRTSGLQSRGWTGYANGEGLVLEMEHGQNQGFWTPWPYRIAVSGSVQGSHEGSRIWVGTYRLSRFLTLVFFPAPPEFSSFLFRLGGQGADGIPRCFFVCGRSLIPYGTAPTAQHTHIHRTISTWSHLGHFAEMDVSKQKSHYFEEFPWSGIRAEMW